ncbi:MAG: nickel pincer cofactor biosynthesis protein LarB [Planctomycetota bacterium]
MNTQHAELPEDAAAILRQIAAGELAPEAGLEALRGAAPSLAEDLGYARGDHDRAERCGFPEVVFCQGKTGAQAAGIATSILSRAPRVLLTRASAEHAEAVLGAVPDAVHHEDARCIVVDRAAVAPIGRVAVVAAGTADLPVAAEAVVTARAMGASVETFFDVGVAGLHRLLARLPEIRRARAIVAVAGMEGALPSVLAGLVRAPVVAVPTSVGYGVGHGGLSALSTMLSSCAAGVVVVNIDNGFGAGYAAAQINRLGENGPAGSAVP